MPLPRKAVRWLPWFIAVLISTTFLFSHAFLVKAYLDRETATPLHGKTVTTPLQRIFPDFAADGQVCVRDALALDEGHSVRMRYTDLDNAPYGREVHWDSGWLWYLAGLGHLRAAFTGEPLRTATENAVMWSDLSLLLPLLLGFSIWAGRRMGPAAAVVVAIALAGDRNFYQAFYPNYGDHHGIANAALLGLVLGAVFMGAGWWRDRRDDEPALLPRSRKHALFAATVSGVFGAIGLWTSAASTVVPIALIGAGGVAMALFAGRGLKNSGATADPEVWRRWGRTGALTALGFYLFEYAPNGFAMRLEVNHPLYQLAWLGGGELVALVLAWRVARIAASPVAPAKASTLPVGKKEAQKAAARAAQAASLAKASTSPATPPAGAGVKVDASVASDWETRLVSIPWIHWVLALLAVAATPVAVMIGRTEWFMPMDPFMLRIHDRIAEFQPLWVMMRMNGWRPYCDNAGLLLLPFLAALWILLRRRAPVEARGMVVYLLAIVVPGTALGWLQNRWLLTASPAHISLVMVLVVAWLSSWKPSRPAWLRALAAFIVCAVLYTTIPYLLITQGLNIEKHKMVQPGEAIELLYRDIAEALRADQPQGDITLLASPNGSTAIGYFGRFKTIGTLYWENGDGLRDAARIFSATSDAEAAALIRQRHITHIALVSNFNFLIEYRHALYPEIPITTDGIGGTFGWRLLYDDHLPVWLRRVAYAPPPSFNQIGTRVRLFAVNTAMMAHTPKEAQDAARKAWTEATTYDTWTRNGPDALRLAQLVVKAVPENPVARQVLAAAFAENSLWPEAIGAATQAIDLAQKQNNLVLSALLQTQLESYQNRKPWRE